MMRYPLMLLLIVVCFGCKTKYEVPKTVQLHDNWQFKKVNDTVWNTATVPGNVHSDLLDNKLIEHPFIGSNADSLQWISDTDWEYKTNFKVDKQTLNKKHVTLNFEGLDTYANVYLNDSLILKSNNAFRTHEIDVKPVLKVENELKIIFDATVKQEEVSKANSPYNLPEGNRIYTRKAQFQYGWDWGPKLNTSGIWKPITLEGWNQLKIMSIDIGQTLITDEDLMESEVNEDNKEGEVAFLGIRLDVVTSRVKPFTYHIYVNDKLHSSQLDSLTFLSSQTFANLTIDIQNPKKWWPHNLGDPYLYDIKVVVKDAETILDSISTKIGIRTIDLVTEKDSLGESFYLKVNNVPVYAKGANYIPQNSMQNKVTDAHYDNLLNDVVDANMNMLRVWGGGIYENDVFYDLCDEKGILVWQDFMFACAMYPGDKAFLDNVKTEAEQQVKRLSNHASIALWCGNNESSEGWHRWGWQADRSETEKEAIWNDYLAVFDSILPKAVKQYSNTDYWESSPKYGRGNPKYKTEGDAHDWWIWHDAYPFEHLENNVPRFMSEFGFQSFPSYEAIKYINQSDSINISSEVFKTHQKHSLGFQLIEDYMQRDFPVPDNAEDYVYVSQLLQAYGITKGIEAQRRAKPYNMGTLYWQLNDCWPVVSWSSIDFFGNWKALHYKAKRSFEDVLISSKVENNILKTYLINDDLGGYGGSLVIKIIDFNGRELINKASSIYLPSGSSKIKNEIDLESLDINKDEVVVLSTFNNVKSYFYLVKPKDLKLNQAEIEQKITNTKAGFTIELSSKTFQKDVFLISENKGHFSDNFFDLIPNRPTIIHFTTKSLKLNDLKIKTFNKLLR